MIQRGRPRGDLLVFDEEDFAYDYCDAETWGSYGVSFFIFTAYFQPYVKQVARTRFELPLWHSQFHAGEGRVFNFKVVRLGQQPWFLGAICFRRPSVRFDAESGWNIGSPGALSSGPIKPVLHAHYPADGWPETDETLDFNAQEDGQRNDRMPVFARDYNQMMARAEATLVHQADRDLPELSLVGEGVRLLAEVAERTVLTADDLNEPAGQVRIALSVLALLTLRGACTVVLLLEPGYVPEAGVILNRMTSAVELARLIDRDDEEATVAERFIAGAGLDELEPETWANIAEAVAVNIEQLPQLGLIHTPLGPRPGLGFAGSREPTRAKELAVDAASLLVDMTVLCGATLLGGTAPELLAQRLITLRAEVAREMHSPISGRGDSAHDAEASASSDDGSASTSRAGNS